VFGVGPTEVLVIAVLALMMFSPRELPKMLRSVAKFWAQLRSTADEFKDAIMNADGVDELQNMIKGTKEELRRAENDARKELMKARVEMRKAQQRLSQTAKAKEEIRKRDQGELPVDAPPVAADAEPVARSGDSPRVAAPPPVTQPRTVARQAASVVLDAPDTPDAKDRRAEEGAA
jgi:Tat protein translocase TatB subunit